MKKLSEKDEKRLDELFEEIQEESERFVGYPTTAVFDYSPLFRFMQYPINNVGDPYLPSNYHLNTHEFECEVLEVFSGLTSANAQRTWGYVTNGGTEGNMYGIFLARELYPDGVVYYSEDTHYSVDKILRCLKMRSIMIRSQPDGRMDLDDLHETLKIHRDAPPIVFANVGTTMKGAVDDLEGIQNVFGDLAIQRRYVHADAALSGMILPFVDDPGPWDFRAGIDSISTSGHKMIGSPIPCGLVLAKKDHVERIAQSVEYIGTMDTTLSGSRNGLTPLFLWYAFRTIGLDGYRERIKSCISCAQYAVERLREIGRNAWRHDNSITVVFDRPSMEIISRWQLAVHKDIAHLITMPHVTHDQVDQVVAEIAAEEKGRKVSLPASPEAAKVPPCATDGKRVPITMIGPSRPDLVQEISTAMASNHINIESISAAQVGELDIINMTVDNRDRAMEVLTRSAYAGRLFGQARMHEDEQALQTIMEAQLEPVSPEAILVQLQDRPGALAELTHRFSQADIQLRGVRIAYRTGDKTIIAISTDRPDDARALVQENLV
jgi:histidine decarboxylase